MIARGVQVGDPHMVNLAPTAMPAGSYASIGAAASLILLSRRGGRAHEAFHGAMKRPGGERSATDAAATVGAGDDGDADDGDDELDQQLQPVDATGCG
jgi:hypothetical protein